MKTNTNLKAIYSTANIGDFQQNINLELTKEFDLRYGENPNQQAGAYYFSKSSVAELTDLKVEKSGKGGVSANNLMDMCRSFEILKFFTKPSVAVMKHLNPSGFATEYKSNSLVEIYKNARDADARSAFGSVVVFNTKLDIATAEEINTTFVEMVVAPAFDEGVLELFNAKKNLRVVSYSSLDRIPKFVGDDTEELYDIKALPTGRLVVQKPYLSSIKSEADLMLKAKVERNEQLYEVNDAPTAEQLDDLMTAWYINLGVRSNGIVIVKNGVSICIGTGQQERVGAIEQAIIKAYQKSMDQEGISYDAIDGAKDRDKLSHNPLEGAVMSSDAFFPFRDSIDIIAKHGIKSIIQPGGSMRDYEVIEAVNEHKLSMAFTMERCFGHF